jgi:hypothetical protein
LVRLFGGLSMVHKARRWYTRHPATKPGFTRPGGPKSLKIMMIVPNVVLRSLGQLLYNLQKSLWWMTGQWLD